MKRAILALTAAALSASVMTSCSVLKRVDDDPLADSEKTPQTTAAPDTSADAAGVTSDPAVSDNAGAFPGRTAEEGFGEKDTTAGPDTKVPQSETQSAIGAGRPTTAVPTHGTKYTGDELLALENERKGWGPGANVDEQNRPTGATYYQSLYGNYDADFIIENDSAIFLTFDCGYENGYTEKIIDTLNEKGVKGIFFCTMDYVSNNKELVQKMIDGGHIVGNHSVRHLSMPTLSVEEMEEEILGVHEYVKENFGYEMFLFRPPMGEFSERSLAAVQNLGYRTVEWSFAYADWDPANQLDPAIALEKVTSSACPGGIFLLHAVSSTNAAILGDAIDAFHRMGYELKTYAR